MRDVSLVYVTYQPQLCEGKSVDHLLSLLRIHMPRLFAHMHTAAAVSVEHLLSLLRIHTYTHTASSHAYIPSRSCVHLGARTLLPLLARFTSAARPLYSPTQQRRAMSANNLYTISISRQCAAPGAIVVGCARVCMSRCMYICMYV